LLSLKLQAHEHWQSDEHKRHALKAEAQEEERQRVQESFEELDQDRMIESWD